MKISCYLRIAILVLCIFKKTCAWTNNDQQFYFDNDQYLEPSNEYKSVELSNNKRIRNIRDTDFDEIEENLNYDTSNDLYPSLNLFSWWSSKNRAKGARNVTTSRGSSGADSSFGTGRPIATTLPMDTVRLTNLTNLIGRIRNMSTVTKSIELSATNAVHKGTVQFLPTPSSNLTESEMKNLSRKSTEVNIINQIKAVDIENNEINVTSSRNFTASTLPIVPLHEAVTDKVNFAVNERSLKKTGSTLIMELKLKPTFKSIQLNKSKEVKMFTAYPGIVGSSSAAGLISDDNAFSRNEAVHNKNNSNAHDNYLKNATMKNASEEKSLTVRSLKQFIFNSTRYLRFRQRGSTLPYPPTPIPTTHMEITTSTSLTTYIRSASPIHNQMSRAGSAKEDPLYFLKPIPTLKYDIYNITQLNIVNSGDNPLIESRTLATVPNSIDETPINLITDAHKSYVYPENNHTNMKFVLPEYSSGLNDHGYNNFFRKKRTSKNATENINNLIKKEQEIKNLIIRSCKLPRESPEIFLPKFKNLQNDLSDLQKAIVSEAKGLSDLKNHDANLTVHVRVIVDVDNNTNLNNDISPTRNEFVSHPEIDFSLEKRDSNHSLSKRSWFYLPYNNHLPNQQQNSDESLLSQNNLEKLAKESSIGMANEELDNGNNNMKVNLNFPIAKILTNENKHKMLNINVEKEHIVGSNNIDKNSQYLLTARQLNPTENKLCNPINKAIYSKYITGQKYLVIPLFYLEEQNRNNKINGNNSDYNVLQPSSIYLKNFQPISKSYDPPDLIANYLSKYREKIGKINNNDKNISHQDNVNKKDKVPLSNADKNATVIVGKPEIVLEFANNLDDVKINKYKYLKQEIHRLNSNLDLKNSLNILNEDLLKDKIYNDSRVNLNKNNIASPKVECIKYPLYLLVKPKNNVTALSFVSNKGSPCTCNKNNRVVFFTKPNKEFNGLATEATFCSCNPNLIAIADRNDKFNYNLEINPEEKKKLTKTNSNVLTSECHCNRARLLDKTNKGISIQHPHKYDVFADNIQSSLLFGPILNEKKRLELKENRRFKRKSYTTAVNVANSTKDLELITNHLQNNLINLPRMNFNISRINATRNIATTTKYVNVRDLLNIKGFKRNGNEFHTLYTRQMNKTTYTWLSAEKTTQTLDDQPHYSSIGNETNQSTDPSTTKIYGTQNHDLECRKRKLCLIKHNQKNMTTMPHVTKCLLITTTPNEKKGHNDCEPSAFELEQTTASHCEHPFKEHHSTIKPKGYHCHHHLKNHTTLEHHKIKGL